MYIRGVAVCILEGWRYNSFFCVQEPLDDYIVPYAQSAKLSTFGF